MPNFKTYSISMPDFPVELGDSKFLYKATCINGETMVKVSQKDEDFFILIKKKQDGLLVKADKVSRPSQVVFVQTALQNFRDVCKCEVTYSNIEPQKVKTKKRFEALKDIDFFANEYMQEKEIWLEIGFGSGRHLLYQAKKHPDIQFIGLEIHKPSLEQVAKQCKLQEIQNIFLLDYDARIFLEFLRANSVGKIFVHFPVPWDKKPHKRVISSEFIKESLKCLKVSGTLELRTDSQNYFDYSLSEFLKLEHLNLHINKNRDLDISSKYEDRWKRQEKDIYDITLKNEISSQESGAIGKIEFDRTFDFAKIYKNFKKMVINEKISFLHVEDIFSINEKEGLVRISFGASTKSQRVFVEFLSNSTRYFPNNILATKANLFSHDLLMKWLEELAI